MLMKTIGVLLQCAKKAERAQFRRVDLRVVSEGAAKEDDNWKG